MDPKCVNEVYLEMISFLLRQRDQTPEYNIDELPTLPSHASTSVVM